MDERLQKPKEGGATPAFNPQTVDLGIRAETLIAVDLLDERLQKPKEGGATPAFNPQTVDLKAEIQKVTQERGLDVVVEASGYPELLPQIFDLCRIGGRVILLGSIWHRTVEIDFMDFHLNPHKP